MLNLGDLVVLRPVIRSIFDELSALGHADAAARTAEVLDMMKRLNELQLELYSVWAALDCWPPGSSRELELERALSKWREARAPKPAPGQTSEPT